MHKLKCLILIFCFTSMQIAFADSISASVDANMAAQRTACDKNTAMEWSAKLSRCVGKQAAVDARNATAACDALTDIEAKKKCNIAIAEKSTGLSSDTGSLKQGNTGASMAMNSITTAYAALSILSTYGSKGENSDCTCKTIFAVTSVAGLASDVYLKMKAKSKVKELEGKYMLDKTSSASEAQVKALEYLKEEQQTVVSIANMEKKRNMALMLGYGLSAGYAVYEMTYGLKASCKPDDKGPKSDTGQTTVTATPASAPPADATVAATTTAPAATPAPGSVSSVIASMQDTMKPLKKYLDSPMGIAIAAGIATVYSGVLYKAADKQEKDSNENVAKVDKMIKSFKDSGANFCMNGRDSMADAKCYCYAADGSKNSNRTNSQTCIDLWAKNDYKITGDAANYGLLTYNPDVAGCVTVDNQFDEACKCKKLIDAKGANACQKESSISMASSPFSTSFATGSGIKDLANYAANATNGNPRFDLLNSATLGTKAIKASHMAENITSKIPASDKTERAPLINESNVDKYAHAVIGDKALAAASKLSSATNVASARSDNPAMNNLLQQAQTKVGIDVMGSGKGLSAKKDKKKNSFDLNLGGDGGGNSGGQVIGNFPEEKSYKFKNSDIVTDNSASIFEIISNRYVQSGLKRLFDDDTK